MARRPPVQSNLCSFDHQAPSTGIHDICHFIRCELHQAPSTSIHDICHFSQQTKILAEISPHRMYHISAKNEQLLRSISPHGRIFRHRHCGQISGVTMHQAASSKQGSMCNTSCGRAGEWQQQNGGIIGGSIKVLEAQNDGSMKMVATSKCYSKS